MRSVQLTANVPLGLPPARGDRVHLQQVLLNLIINAMDAVNARPNREALGGVQARADGNDAIEVAVSDSGHGIRPEEIAHLFEPFFTTKANGMGMGLAISRTIVKAHGGRIWAESNAAHGATFRFTLCVAKSSDAGAAA